MPVLATAEEWLVKSRLLLQARPATTRISTKYTLTSPTKSLRAVKKASRSKVATTTKVDGQVRPAPATKAVLTLRTYCPASGVTLKYETDKAAEVGRLILACSKLGLEMAGLPELKEGTGFGEVGSEGAELRQATATPTMIDSKAAPATTGGQGDRKKKKKGKK